VSWYNPLPVGTPLELSRVFPAEVVPSGIGDEGIVGNWLFYYLKGGDHLHDFSPKENHGTLKNDPVWVSRRCGWALDLDGKDDYIEIPDDSSLDDDLTNGFTINVWVKRDFPDSGTGDDLRFVVKDTDYDFFVNAGGDLRLDDHDTGGFDIDIGKTLTGWNMFTATVDSGGTGELFVNSNSLGTGDWSSQLDSLGSTNSVTFGVDPSGDYLDAIIAIIRIYSVAKSDSWIKRRFERTKGIFKS